MNNIQNRSEIYRIVFTSCELIAGIWAWWYGARYLSFSAGAESVRILMLVFFISGTLFFWKIRWEEAVGAVILALFESLGSVESMDAVSTALSFDSASINYTLRTFALGVLFFRVVIAFCFFLFDHLKPLKKKHRKIRSYLYIPICTAIGFIACLPYYYAYYPGIANADALWQIKQAYGALNLNNWLSVFHTMLIRFCIEHAGGVEAGLSMYCLLSILAMSFVFACCLYTAYENSLVVWPLAVFFWLNPFNGMNAVSISKDTFFALAVLAFTVLLWCACRKEKWPVFYYIALIVSGVCISLLRSNGFYAFAASIPFLIICLRKHWFQIACCIAAVLASCFLFTGPYEKSLHTEQVDSVESLSIPLQQISYTVIHGGNISARQKAELNHYIDVDQIQDQYVPYISDAVKDLMRSTGNMKFLEKDKRAFLNLWKEIGMQNKLAYLKAFALQTRGYWYFSNDYYWKNLTAKEGDQFGDYTYTITPKMKDSSVQQLKDLKEFTDQKLYSRMWSISLSDWLLIILILYGIKERRKDWFVGLPCFFIMGTLMVASPVAQEFRYAYSIFLTVPMLIAMTAADHKETTSKKDNAAPAWVIVPFSAVLFAMIWLLNVYPNIAPVADSYHLVVFDDLNQKTDYHGKTFARTLQDLLNERVKRGDFTYSVEGDSLKEVNGLEANYSVDTSKWGIKVDWGESQYDLSKVTIPDESGFTIWIVYEKDNW